MLPMTTAANSTSIASPQATAQNRLSSSQWQPVSSQWQPVSATLPTELFAPPSAEHVWLLRHAPALVAPQPGQDTLWGRFARMVMVAPMTQCTLLSFDLQVFLYGVFHTTLVARIGHFVFQAAVTFWLLVAVSHWSLPALGQLGNGAVVGGTVLLLWYAAMALQYRLWLWVALMVPVVAGLVWAAVSLGQSGAALMPAQLPWLAALPLGTQALLWAVASAAVVALSHAPEPKIPPRTVEGDAWLSIADYVFKPGPFASHRALRAIRVGLYSVWGTLDELWASPRLVPYGVLLLLFAGGYLPDVADRHRQWLTAAWASGNPALDYVGIGGATYLRLAPPIGLIVLVLLGALALVAPSAAIAQSSPELTVTVTSKAIAGSTLPQWTVRAVVPAPASAVWNVVDDCANYKRSMPRVVASRVVSRTPTRVVCHTTVGMPFPFSNLQSESEGLVAVTAGRWQRDFRHLTGDFVKNDGSWTLTPTGADGQHTQVVYVLHSIPAISVPDALIRRGQESAMHELMRNVARLARQP